MKNSVITVFQRIMLFVGMLSVVFLDQAIKWIIRSFPVGHTVLKAEPLFEIVHMVNAGAAFSILSGKTAVLIVLTTVMLLILAAAVFFYADLNLSIRWCLVFLLGGGIGNWLDRIISGGVTDYIRLLFVRFPVFNFADMCITGSAAVLILLLLNRLEPISGD